MFKIHRVWEVGFKSRYWDVKEERFKAAATPGLVIIQARR